MGIVKWFGRMLWWLVAWPIGLWRSLRHGRKKDTKKIIKAIEKRDRETPLPK